MGRDKGKFNKRGGRGGGSRFQATSAEEIEARSNRIAEFDEKRAKRRGDDEEGEEGVEEVGKEVEKMSFGENANRAEADANPMTRKQREQAEKERKAAEYRARHERGETDEYKRDMAKLLEVRARREAATKRAAAEKEAEEAAEKDRQARLEAANLDADSDSDSDDDKKKKKKSSKKKASVPKLDKIVIKKMKPTQLKEALKARGLDIQGNAKALTTRLLEYEASR